MSIAVSFILRSASQSKPVTVSLRIRPNRQNWVFPTPITILSSQWDAKRGKPSTKGDNATNPYLTEIRAKLNDIEDGVSEYISKCEAEHTDLVKTTVADIIKARSIGQNIVINEVPTDMSEYLAYFIIEIGGDEKKRKEMKIERVRYKTTGRYFSAGTIKMWKVFQGVFLNFRPYYETIHKCPLSWDTFKDNTVQVFNSFVTFCEDWGYRTTTTNKYLICFKSFVRYAAKLHHLHPYDNDDLKNNFGKIAEEEGCSQTRIYLTNSELQSLYDMPLSGLKEQVRDVFLVGCYTGQRVSDYANLKQSDFHITETGRTFLIIKQKKTRETVTIPIIYPNLQSIIEKYNYQLPNISDVIINRYIKDICKDLSETVPSLNEPIRTIITLRDERKEQKAIADGNEGLYNRDEEGNTYKRKYELVCTHTARRSGITNLYKTGLFPKSLLMKISGHKTEKHFDRYLLQSGIEDANKIYDIAEEAIKKGLF